MGLQNFMRSYCRWSFVKPALRSIVRYWCPGYLGQNATYILVVFFMSDDWLEGVSTLRIVQSQEPKHVCYSSVCASWATALKPEWNSLPLGCGYIWNLWFVNVKIFFHLNKGDRVFFASYYWLNLIKYLWLVVAFIKLETSHWWPFLELLSWCPIFMSSPCNSLEDLAPVDFIYVCPIFKRVAVTWLHDSYQWPLLPRKLTRD